MFQLLKFVIKHIKTNNNVDLDADRQLRDYIHNAIQYLNHLDRCHVNIYSEIFCTIVTADKKLKLLTAVRMVFVYLYRCCDLSWLSKHLIHSFIQG